MHTKRNVQVLGSAHVKVPVLEELVVRETVKASMRPRQAFFNFQTERVPAFGGERS
jgi:hypothetical protein